MSTGILGGGISGPDPGVVPDPRCLNGVFVPGAAVALHVDSPQSDHLELDSCNGVNQRGKLRADLMDPSGTSLAVLTPIDSTNAGPDDACAELDYSFPSAGVYKLQIAVADSFLPVGDLSLKFFTNVPP